MSLTFSDGDSNSVVDLGGDSSIDTGTSGAACAWVYPTTFATNHMVVGRRFDATNRAFYLYLIDGLGNFGFLAERATSNAVSDSTGTPLTINTWNFIAVTWALASAPAVLWHGDLDTAPIDVTNTGTDTAGSGAANFGNAANLGIGNAIAGAAASAWAGDIAWVGVWDDELVPNKVTQLWASQGLHVTGPTQSLYMPLGWEFGLVNQPDYSGNGNSGTVGSGVTVGVNPPFSQWGYYHPRLHHFKASSVAGTSLLRGNPFLQRYPHLRM